MGRNTTIRHGTCGDRFATGKDNNTFRIRSGFQPAHTANKRLSLFQVRPWVKLYRAQAVGKT